MSAIDDIDPVCRNVIQAVIDKVGAERFPSPPRLDDASWIGFRLAEMLPLEPTDRQAILEMTDAAARLAEVRRLLARHGIGTG